MTSTSPPRAPVGQLPPFKPASPDRLHSATASAARTPSRNRTLAPLTRRSPTWPRSTRWGTSTARTTTPYRPRSPRATFMASPWSPATPTRTRSTRSAPTGTSAPVRAYPPTVPTPTASMPAATLHAPPLHPFVDLSAPRQGWLWPAVQGVATQLDSQPVWRPTFRRDGCQHRRERHRRAHFRSLGLLR